MLHLSVGCVQGVRQTGDASLPPGPVLTSPDRLIESFTREVIRRKPQEFKIEALKAIRDLFPPGVNCFYAGFGNRPTDTVAYEASGVPLGKIFIINPEVLAPLLLSHVLPCGLVALSHCRIVALFALSPSRLLAVPNQSFLFAALHHRARFHT